MKKIIDDLLYDTETAKLIYEDSKGRHMRLFYMTENKHYFCVYANGHFEPMTEQAVKGLLGEVDVDKYLELFPSPKKA